MDVIQLDQYVMVQRKSFMSLHQLPKKSGKSWTIKLGRDQVDLSSAVDKPYGAFRLSCTKAGKHKLFTLEPTDEVLDVKNELLKNACSGENNQDIWDDGESQQLKKEDIDELKEKGLSGKEILSQLVENSKTFQIKTEYSQEKYLAKKEEKYSECVEILKPSIRLLSKFYYTQDPMKVLNLRPDMLAVVMSAANVKAGGQYAILDGGCQGLITAAVLDRLQGSGIVWNLYTKGQPQKQAIHAMNFTKEHSKPLRNLSLLKVKELMLGNDDEGETPAKVPKLDEEALPKLELGTLDGLIIACRRPSGLVSHLLKLLLPSRNFVVFCPYIEPLGETYMQLRECNLAVNLKVTEIWLRNYQVLPMRTHPDVTMSGSGGFLLSGINVVSS